MQYIYNQCEILMSYPPSHLFTEESTKIPAVKKAEPRCVKVVDKYYRIDSSVHQCIRNLLHDIRASLMLMCNTTALEDTLTSCGRLQAQFEAHRKTVIDTVKSEPLLKDYYSLLQKADWFGTVLVEVLSIAEMYNFEVDVQACKKTYFDAMKDEHVKLKGE